MTKLTKQLIAAFSVLLLWVGSLYAVFKLAEDHYLQKFLDNLTSVCYNSSALIDGGNGRYFICLPARVEPQEQRSLDRKKDLTTV